MANAIYYLLCRRAGSGAAPHRDVQEKSGVHVLPAIDGKVCAGHEASQR